jgi:hypothetical protein
MPVASSRASPYSSAARWYSASHMCISADEPSS